MFALYFGNGQCVCVSVASKGIFVNEFKSLNPLQSEYALQIPRLTNWAEQATRKAESLRRRMHNVDSKGERPFHREVRWEDEEEEEEDAEMRQKFVEYQTRLIKEEEEQKVLERAAFIQAEKVKQQRTEEAARQEIEQNAINDYKREQDEIKALNLEREKQLKEVLARLDLEPEKIDSIIQSPLLQISTLGGADKKRSSPNSTDPSIDDRENIKIESDESLHAASIAPKKTYSIASWYVYSIKSIYHTACEKTATTNCRS